MRIGINKQKNVKTDDLNFLFHVVMPIYIPHLKGYYTESLDILRTCLLSLLETIERTTFISVIDNGSCDEVIDYLNDLYNEQKIQEVIHTSNIGKLNAAIKGIAGHEIPLVTVTDADILFEHNWQSETLTIFKQHPKSGVVGLIPQLKMFSTYSANLIFDNLFSTKLSFTDVDDPESIALFYESIGWNDNYNKDYLQKHLTLSKGDSKAIVGSGHAVATYKREVFSDLLQETSTFKLGGDSESRFLDIEVLKYDGWRLTTCKAYAHHMGNTLEPFMQARSLRNTNNENSTAVFLNENWTLKKNSFNYLIKSKIFKKIFKYRWFYLFFLNLKGLPSHMIHKY